MEMVTTSMEPPDDEIWRGQNEANLLESRIAGFWNPDYLQRIIIPLLDLSPNARVLDVGCGIGGLTFALATLLPNAHFVGVDITPSLVEAARVKAAKLGLRNIEFQDGDARHLPFANEEFNAVVCQTVLAFVSDPAAIISEITRVLVRSGTFLSAEYHTLSSEWPIDEVRLDVTDAEAAEAAKYLRMLIRGFKSIGQADLRIGGKVPFLARQAGLTVLDVRINDYVPHAFPPSSTAKQNGARGEARAVVNTYADAQWRVWVGHAMTAGGGTQSDLDTFLNLLPDQQRHRLSTEEDTYAFVWLINPVLLITIGRKPQQST